MLHRGLQAIPGVSGEVPAAKALALGGGWPRSTPRTSTKATFSIIPDLRLGTIGILAVSPRKARWQHCVWGAYGGFAPPGNSAGAEGRMPPPANGSQRSPDGQNSSWHRSGPHEKSAADPPRHPRARAEACRVSTSPPVRFKSTPSVVEPRTALVAGGAGRAICARCGLTSASAEAAMRPWGLGGGCPCGSGWPCPDRCRRIRSRCVERRDRRSAARIDAWRSAQRAKHKRFNGLGYLSANLQRAASRASPDCRSQHRHRTLRPPSAFNGHGRRRQSALGRGMSAVFAASTGRKRPEAPKWVRPDDFASGGKSGLIRVADDYVIAPGLGQSQLLLPSELTTHLPIDRRDSPSRCPGWRMAHSDPRSAWCRLRRFSSRLAPGKPTWLSGRQSSERLGELGHIALGGVRICTPWPHAAGGGLFATAGACRPSGGGNSGCNTGFD